MYSKPCRFIVASLVFSLSLLAPGMSLAGWRSVLYPENWKPGYADQGGRFLHDFSYAGYHYGEVPPPLPAGEIIDVTQSPYNADNKGSQDATPAIQAAIDAAEKMGGGVVFMPAGIYRVLPDANRNWALTIRRNGVVLRGAGADKTHLFNDSTQMRQKHVFHIEGSARWYDEAAGSTLLAKDVLTPSVQIPVADTTGFKVGSRIFLRNDVTARFIQEHNMTGIWQEGKLRGPVFCRTVTAVDAETRTLTLDIPTRYPLRMADNARVVRMQGNLVSEVGLEDFSIGMRELPQSGPVGEGDFDHQGTSAYDAHFSTAIWFESAENCWVRKVNSYHPPTNKTPIHVISNGICLNRSRLVTIESCDWRATEFQCGGGNGYCFIVCGNECLIRDCYAEKGRHNYSFKEMGTSGNVITRCTDRNGRLASDYHMMLSMSNLVDSMICDGSFLEATYRPWSGGITSSQSVFWNTKGLAYPGPLLWEGKLQKPKDCVVDSHQFGNGYVIGTSGRAWKVSSDNFVEGAGKGDSLMPQSLYADQLARRLGTRLPANTGGR